eukprot:4956919-Pyramimonas_sp.AAC.1
MTPAALCRREPLASNQRAWRRAPFWEGSLATPRSGRDSFKGRASRHPQFDARPSSPGPAGAGFALGLISCWAPSRVRRGPPALAPLGDGFAQSGGSWATTMRGEVAQP